MKKNIKFIEEYLKSIKGQEITKCYRKFFDEKEGFPNSLVDLERDGDVYLELTDGNLLYFYSSTENFSIDFEMLNFDNLPNDVMNISDCSYWSERLLYKITDMDAIYSEYSDVPYGINIYLENKKTISIQYISENEYTFDALIIK